MTCFGSGRSSFRRARISAKSSFTGIHPAEKSRLDQIEINIDTGAFATDRLTCLVIEELSLSVIDTLGT